MKRRLTVAFAVCCTVVLAAGCGSSKSSSSSSTGSSESGGSPQSRLIRNGKINYAKPPANAPVSSGVVTIHYHQIAIEPDTLKVKVDSTIKWVNEDENPIEHNVTSDGGPIKFASKNLHEGQTFTVKMTKPGVIHYKCTFHPATMNGTIEVVK